MVKTRTPTAGVVIYSYNDRGGSKYPIIDTSVETMYLTKSIISIKTSKRKSNPSGNFEITLAPTRNWIAAISPGSWLEIHMSSDKMSDEDLKKSDFRTLKMIGCVDSVRMSVQVEPESGSRMTVYSIIGRDWGCVFESYIYIDPTAQSYEDSALQQALKPFWGGLSFGELSTTQMARNFIKAWGTTMALTIGSGTSLGKDLKLDKLKSSAVYSIPQPLASKLNLFPASTNVSQLLKIKSGYLSDYDNYQDYNESYGLLNTQSLIGVSSFWQLLSEHTNLILNELIADLRWESDKPDLTLYKRIKPFTLNNPYLSGKNQNLLSYFFNVKRLDILKEDVINLNIGNNTQDIINFIEVLPDTSIHSYDSQVDASSILIDAKTRNHIINEELIARHGVKPILYTTNFYPQARAYGSIREWLPILGHWYFDSHKMLNGVVTIIGQDGYIGVGDNISLDAKILGDTSYVVNAAKLLAQVESVDHTFTFLENGSRRFITSISFTRGVMTDDKCKKLAGINSYGVETLSLAVPYPLQNINNTYLK